MDGTVKGSHNKTIILSLESSNEDYHTIIQRVFHLHVDL